jgi:hypothetical protein
MVGLLIFPIVVSLVYIRRVARTRAMQARYYAVLNPVHLLLSLNS